MKQKVIFLALSVGFALLMVGAYFVYDKYAVDNAPDQLAVLESEAPATEVPTTEMPSSTTQPVTVQAPDFTVYDLEGNAVRLSDYFGKPIVLNFWASWCGPCQSEMPDFNEACAKLQGEVQFLMVNMTDGARETVEVASGFIAEQGYTFPVFYDTASEAAITYSVYSLPTTYFISADGTLTAQATGAIDAETLQRGIDMIYN